MEGHSNEEGIAIAIAIAIAMTGDDGRCGISSSSSTRSDTVAYLVMLDDSLIERKASDNDMMHWIR